MHTKYCAHGDPRGGAVTLRGTEPHLPASVGRSSAGGWGGWLCFTMETRRLAAEVLGSTPWCEPSHSQSLAPPKSRGRLQCWVASGITTNREGTQPHPSTVKWIKVLRSSDHQSLPSSLLDSLNHQRADSRSKKTTILQPVEQKPHSQKDREDEKAEGYVPDEGTRKKPQKNN